MTCLPRILVSASLLVLASGCPGDDGTAEGSGGSTAAGTTVTVDDTTAGADATVAGTTAGSGSASTGEGTTEAPATDSGPGTTAGTTEATTTGESSSGGAAGPSLGMCIGTGAWNNCTQYCESEGDTCVPSGCDGATIHYYNDVGACAAMEADQTSTMGCSEDFTMGMGISFARCCCE